MEATPAGAARRESISPVHLATSGHRSPDGRNTLGRPRGLYTIACLRTSGSRLSDHSGPHVLSGCKPERDGDNGNRAAGTPIWRIARLEPDDVYELRGHFRHRAAV